MVGWEVGVVGWEEGVVGRRVWREEVPVDGRVMDGMAWHGMGVGLDGMDRIYTSRSNTKEKWEMGKSRGRSRGGGGGLCSLCTL